MKNLIEKKFFNEELGIKITSFIDEKLIVWFKAKEVAQVLNYKNTEKAIKRHVSENHKRKILFTNQQETHGCSMTYFLDEAGFYELVFKSRLPAAKIFREWVFTKVLPSIRKQGYFSKIDLRIKQRVIFEGKKYYKHSVFSNYAANKNGDILSLKNKKIIKMINCNGYLYFNLCDKTLSKPKIYYQHRFVYEVFKGSIPRFFQIDRINNVKFDNRIKNLQLLSHKQNIEKSKNKPIISTCINTGKEKRFISIKEASKELNIFDSNISAICKNKNKTTTSKKDGCKYIFRYLDQFQYYN